MGVRLHHKLPMRGRWQCRGGVRHEDRCASKMPASKTGLLSGMQICSGQWAKLKPSRPFLGPGEPGWSTCSFAARLTYS